MLFENLIPQMPETKPQVPAAMVPLNAELVGTSICKNLYDTRMFWASGMSGLQVLMTMCLCFQQHGLLQHRVKHSEQIQELQIGSSTSKEASC